MIQYSHLVHYSHIMATSSSDEEGQTAWLHSYLSTVWFFLACVLVIVISRFANKKLFKWVNSVVIFLCYGAGLGIVVAVPSDAAYTNKARLVETEAVLASYDSESETLMGQYISLYWLTLVLGLLMYWIEIYSHNGYFTLVDRFRDTTRRMAVDYFALSVAGAGFVAILITTESVPSDSDALTTLMVSLSNTLGLSVVSIIVGYGLAAWPQRLW